jgi:hypothetical protein
MENWEYAFGVRDLRSVEDAWTNNSDPGTYAEAEIALTRALAKDDPTSDYSLNGPCIVKRSSRHPEWQPVRDHAAELLSEAMGDVFLSFAALGPNVLQGNDLNRVFRRLAFALRPDNQTNQEFDA